MYTPIQIGTPLDSNSGEARQNSETSNRSGRSHSNPNTGSRFNMSGNTNSNGTTGFSSLLTSFGIRQHSNSNSNTNSTNTVNSQTNNNNNNNNNNTNNNTPSASALGVSLTGNSTASNTANNGGRRTPIETTINRSRTSSIPGSSVPLSVRQQQHQQQMQIQRQIQANMSHGSAPIVHTHSQNYQLPISLSLSSQRENGPGSGNGNPNEQPETEHPAGNNVVIDLTGDNTGIANGVAVSTNPFLQAANSLSRNNTGADNLTHLNESGTMSSPVEQPATAAITSALNNQNKNLRHYVYAADQENSDELLNLQLPPDKPRPEPVDKETLKQRKDKSGFFSIRLTPFIDSSSSTNQGLFFEPVIRKAGPGSQLVIGRYTERVHEAISKIPEQYHPVVFKSKVVSRTHGCFKVDSQGNWYIQDIKSSSGTFLNHQRLSQASTLSKDTLLHDGDILQLGMDFRGGTEEIYRCVRMRVELNRSWKLKANAFNKEALQKMRKLQKLTTGSDEEDCSICLSKIKPCQAIFISPCAHTWHFRCVRRLVMLAYPQFVCPNCRSTCDLEASLDNSDSESESGIESDGDELVDQLNGLMDHQKDIRMAD
ncbi:E3 ubiquitin-protein ligase DMA1 [Nakaseomyces bracarensis]|uniref:E3 ubiquitin-protein ligase DMA1 n=1 Tax=Nakaseomyces bracarensis TaxID=273131 RepID=A0ABR4NUW6_9SACH